MDKKKTARKQPFYKKKQHNIPFYVNADIETTFDWLKLSHMTFNKTAYSPLKIGITSPG